MVGKSRHTVHDGSKHSQKGSCLFHPPVLKEYALVTGAITNLVAASSGRLCLGVSQMIESVRMRQSDLDLEGKYAILPVG